MSRKKFTGIQPPPARRIRCKECGQLYTTKEAKCLKCGKLFRRTHGRQAYCSGRCSQQMRDGRRAQIVREWRKAHPFLEKETP